MSNSIAIGLALASSASSASIASSASRNNSSSSNDKGFYCNKSMPNFNPKYATTAQKQEYASCVNYFYPMHNHAEIMGFKFFIVAMFLVFIFINIFLIRKGSYYYEFVVTGIGLTVIISIPVGLFIYGFLFVFNFI